MAVEQSKLVEITYRPCGLQEIILEPCIPVYYENEEKLYFNFLNTNSSSGVLTIRIPEEEMTELKITESKFDSGTIYY